MKPLLLVLLFNLTLLAQSFIKEYTYHASDNDSKVTARKAALSQVKMLAIEEVGVTIRSSFHNYVDVEDEKVKKVINTKIDTVAQNVTHSKILDESWNGVVFYIKAEIIINPKEVGREIRKTVAKELHELKKQKEATKERIPKKIVKPTLMPQLPAQITQNTITTEPIKTQTTLTPSKLDVMHKDIREKYFSAWMSQEVYQAEYSNGVYKSIYPAYIQTNEFGERRVLKLINLGNTKWSSKSARSLEYIEKHNVKKIIEGKRMLSLHVNHIGSQAFYSAVWVKQSAYDRKRRQLDEFGVSFNEPILKSNNKKLNLDTVQSSQLDAKHIYEREKKFSPWMSAAEWQKLFSENYFNKSRVVPIYTEINTYGERRYINLAYEPSYYWVINTGKTFKVFKKQHTKQMMEGKRLLTLQVSEVDSEKFYTGVWISAKVFERESQKLYKLGIYPPTSE